MKYGPKTEIGEYIHSNNHRHPGETFKDAMSRQAAWLKDSDEHYHKYRDMILEQRFLAGGRIQAAAGHPHITAFNCFVSSTIEDSLVKGEKCIMDVLKESVATLRMGGGIGYDFGTLRPENDIIHTLNSVSSGPVSFMGIFDAALKTISSAGKRRGAAMAVLPINHPDIETYIKAKQPSPQVQVLWDMVAEMDDDNPEKGLSTMALQQTLKLTGFNLSIAVYDKFMEHLATGKPYPLEFQGRKFRDIDPVALWDSIMRSTWDWAEPGALFMDTINRMNNLYYCEVIAAPNPCAEQPGPANMACLLGAFNMVKYVLSDATIDTHALSRDVHLAVRALDNAIDKATFPIPEQKAEALNKRRMGLGTTGMANAIEAVGPPYGSPNYLALQDIVFGVIRDEAYLASAQLAKEKGTFPMYDAEKYTKGEFFKTLPEHVQEAIRTYGLRNSHLTTQAPAGTISITADNVSSGIEPTFSEEAERTIITKDGPVIRSMPDYGVKYLGTNPRTTEHVTVQEHIDVLLSAQRHVDSAVSKTLTVRQGTPWEEFTRIYSDCWEGGAKGCTTFRPDGKRAGVLRKKKSETCSINPETGERDCS